MEIDLVAFIPASAFYMNIQMNMQARKGITLMQAPEAGSASLGDPWKYSKE
jgi:hypothetical protein